MKASLLMMTSLLFLFDASAYAAQLTPDKGDIKFTATGKPGFLKIRGESKGQPPKGTIKVDGGKATGTLEFDLNNFSTGISMRDEHMKEKYLEVKKYPTAKLTLKPLEVTDKELKTDFKKEFQGTLLLHGVSKDVAGTLTYKASDKSVAANFTLKVSDYKIDIPKYMGVVVSENVDVETQMTLK